MVDNVHDSTYEMLFEALGIAQQNGVVLYGLGETLLARAVAHHTDSKCIRVSGSELFVMAREHAQSIIFMDEIDPICSCRGESGSGDGDLEVHRRMLELSSATNCIDILDSALLRHGRINRKIDVPPPGPEARVSILRVHSGKMSLQHGVNLRALAEKMVQCSGTEKRACTLCGTRRQHVTQEDCEFAVAKVLKKKIREGSTSVNKLFS
ncbi:26S proteasome regulatory subunit 8 [Pleurotus pulmonarius]|nr:26S proteasome regulatory subunit 8 [Pleurotus pulmonarius]